ncbi:MAG: chromate transporter [Oscillospiraceae bacterium]|jgi:chromate transporter|nr:chromate transporter [Oscillospiraceae bacterium]
MPDESAMREEESPARTDGPARHLWQIFSTMFVIGLFTFGGGLSMLPQMTRVFVKKRGWVTEEEILDYFAVSQSIPGVIATNTSVMIGYRLAGMAGALCAALGATLPSFLVLVVVTVFYQTFVTHPVMLGALRGVRAAVAALLFFTVWGLRENTLRGLESVLLCLCAVTLVFFLNVNPVWVILGGILLGIARTLYRAKRGPG